MVNYIGIIKKGKKWLVEINEICQIIQNISCGWDNHIFAAKEFENVLLSADFIPTQIGQAFNTSGCCRSRATQLPCYLRVYGFRHRNVSSGYVLHKVKFNDNIRFYSKRRGTAVSGAKIKYLKQNKSSSPLGKLLVNII